MTSARHAEVELRDVPFSDPLRTIQIGSRLISPKVGLIRSISYGVHMPQDSVWLALGGANADLANISDILNSNKSGGGGESLESALAATIGEAVERYCMHFYDKSRMVKAAYREVERDAVAPEDLRLYSRQQVERKPEHVRLDYFDEDLEISWVWGWSLTHKRLRLVPATLVYLQYILDEDEKSPGRNASTGLAAGATLEEAILTGLYEVVERDAFTISWLHRKTGPRIAVDDPELRHWLDERYLTHHPSVDFQIFDITLDVPILSVFGILRRPAEFGPILCVSSVSRLSPRDAIRKCLREVGQGMPYLRYLRRQLADWEPAPDFSDLTSFDHHYTFYSMRPELVPGALAFCDAVHEEVALSEVPDHSTGRVLGDIERCIEMLNAIGKEVIVVDITTPEIRDVGLFVVRVLIPGLVPLHGNHNFPYLGVNRLYDIPRRMAWPTAAFTTYPHPFP